MKVRHCIFLGIISILFLITPTLSFGGDPWTMFHHDPQHTGRSPYVGIQTTTVKWTFTTGSSVWSSPAIAEDGTVYVGSLDKNVYALDGTTGKQK
jgi:hypothetical protein